MHLSPGVFYHYPNVVGLSDVWPRCAKEFCQGILISHPSIDGSILLPQVDELFFLLLIITVS